MSKNYHRSPGASPGIAKHQQEMGVLRAHHERLLSNGALRQASLIGAGVFVRTPDGQLAVAKPYEKVITTKRTS